MAYVTISGFMLGKGRKPGDAGAGNGQPEPIHRPFPGELNNHQAAEVGVLLAARAGVEPSSLLADSTGCRHCSLFHRVGTDREKSIRGFSQMLPLPQVLSLRKTHLSPGLKYFHLPGGEPQRSNYHIPGNSWGGLCGQRKALGKTW